MALDNVRLLLPKQATNPRLCGTEADRGQRNLLRNRWLAGGMAQWLREKVEIRSAKHALPQGALVVSGEDGAAVLACIGSLAFNSEGLGLTAGNPLALIQVSESAREAEPIHSWFEQ